MNEGDRIPYEATELPVEGARKVLVVAPHPDDEAFGCGGTAALFARAGCSVRALVLTDGGLWGEPKACTSIVETRQDESRRAAQILGCAPPVFGPYADRGLQHGPALVEFIAGQVVEFGADVLLAPSPWEFHPDHCAAAFAAIDAIVRLGRGHTLVQYEVGAPLLPNTLADITRVWELKQRAIACFESQLAMQRYDRHVLAQNVFRSYTLSPQVVAAEALRVADPARAAADPFGLVFRGQAHPVCGFIPRPRTRA